MDVKTFTDELLEGLSKTERLTSVDLETEYPVVRGHAYADERTLFLRFYCNEVTGTIAFALIKERQRIWGIDCDNRRGWHVHPTENPVSHIDIEPLSIAEIIVRLQTVLENI